MQTISFLVLALASIAVAAALPLPIEGAELDTGDVVDDDDGPIVYLYDPTGENGIQAPGSSGEDDDDAIAYP
ncbi:hypothetical protein F5Y12DRAFT_415976 [Xylaria sp. FL1777]|nr:hypothetical protein F5Y12DRAFT_415976 [Xylaria sp. FL1777]